MRLMSVGPQARNLAQPQFAAKQPHALIGQPVGNLSVVNNCGAVAEVPWRDAAEPSFAVGEDVELLLDDSHEQFRTPAASVKNHRYAPLAHKAAQFGKHGGQHIRQPFVRLGGYHG